MRTHDGDGGLRRDDEGVRRDDEQRARATGRGPWLAPRQSAGTARPVTPAERRYFGAYRIAAERVRDVRDRLLRAHAVARIVERRRDDGDAELAGRDGDDAAADAALAGQAGAIEPLARVVIEAGGRHHRENTGTLSASRTLLAGHRVLAAGGQRRGHHAEVLGVDADGALPRVEIHRLLPVGLDVAVGEHQRADRLVALVGVGLRLVDVLQHRQRAAGGVVVECR